MCAYDLVSNFSFRSGETRLGKRCVRNSEVESSILLLLLFSAKRESTIRHLYRMAFLFVRRKRQPRTRCRARCSRKRSPRRWRRALRHFLTSLHGLATRPAPLAPILFAQPVHTDGDKARAFAHACDHCAKHAAKLCLRPRRTARGREHSCCEPPSQFALH